MARTVAKRYTANQLGQLAGVAERTVRYYVREQLIDPPAGRGRGAHFDDSHLSQLRRVRLLQDAGLDHAAIRRYHGEIEAILAKKGISRASWEHSWTQSSQQIVRIYHQLSAKRYVPATSAITRVTVAPGIELLVDGAQRLPSPTKLNDVVDHIRAAFGVTDDES